MTTDLARYGIYKYQDILESRFLGITLHSAIMEKLLSKLQKKSRHSGQVPLQNTLGTVRAPARGYSGGRRILAFLANILS